MKSPVSVRSVGPGELALGPADHPRAHINTKSRDDHMSSEHQWIRVGPDPLRYEYGRDNYVREVTSA